MRLMFRQAMSLCLAWVAAGAAESGPPRSPCRAHVACVEESNAQARLAPLWLAAPEPAGPGAAGADLFRLQSSPSRHEFHPVRFRGRTGCGAPGPSSSRFLPATEHSPSAFSCVRRPGDLTDLQARRARSGRGGAGRGSSVSTRFSPSLFRARRPGQASILSVSSSLYQSQ
jgi:hypothetical protein